MRNMILCVIGAASMGLAFAQATPAAQVRITVTNHQPAGGFSFTPVWLGIHDGTFDLFDAGSPASPAIERVAELGDTGPLSADFAGQGPQTTLASGMPVPPFLPAQSASTVLHVADPSALRYLSYASMIVPSNDLFIGNGNPLAIELFDAAGNFQGPLTIMVFGGNVWDAGTEVNDILDGGAFVSGVDATLGTPEGGLVTTFLNDSNAGSYLASILGLTTATGDAISHLFTEDELIATIQVQAVPEPSTLAIASIGLVGLVGHGLRARSRRRRA